MKRIQHAIALLSLALLAGACDLQQIFNERIDDKQLLVLTPDFADTSVQLVFRDPETLAVLDEDFEVTVYSNKRLVDLNGNYKNEFIARGGVMEFSVSPEETVSESDPLEILVNAISFDNSKEVLTSVTSISKNSFNNVILTPTPKVSIEELETMQQKFGDSSMPAKALERVVNKEVTSDLGTTLTFNDLPLARYYNTSGVSVHRFKRDTRYENEKEEFWGFDGRVEEPLKMSVVRGANLVLYNLALEFRDSDVIYTYYISDNGQFVSRARHAFDKTLGSLSLRSGKIENYNHSFFIPEYSKPFYAYLEVYNYANYYKCSSGLNLNITGVEKGEEINLIYKSTRSNGKIFAIASFNVDSPSITYNSLQDGGIQNYHYISENGNKLEFADNAQYIIEPQVIDLGGEELCGNTYTVRLKRRDTHKKHQLNLSMRNENQNVGLALTFSALLRKQGQGDTTWETVNFKQGSTSVYLEEGSTYEVKLTLADEPFEFTFTNDLSLVEAAVQATLRNVTRIKDINYRIIQTADLNTIDAEIVFYEGQSLID